MDVSVIRFNKIGSEGLSSHTVEGESLSFAEDDFCKLQNRYPGLFRYAEGCGKRKGEISLRYDAYSFSEGFSGEYNPQTGNYAEDEIEENTCFALVSETQTEMLKLVYGNLRQGSLTVQVQNHICEPF